tara:strand:+ start:12530 stop:13615 length:1086 start_codon:yes stop_codon:yes gene_type:complete
MFNLATSLAVNKVADSLEKFDLMVCFGTRPEVIKLAPVIDKLSSSEISFMTVFTGQHASLFDDVASLIPPPDVRCNIMGEGQSPSHVMSQIISEMPPYFGRFQPKMVIVQGDTTTSAAVALSAYYHRSPLGHVEAGLRTHDLKAPFPEELNRQLISRIAQLNWAPTSTARKNLEAEGCDGIIVTGNTVIDNCLQRNHTVKYEDKVLVTLHRRENFGKKMASLFRQIEQFARDNPQLEFVFPMHPNPEVLKHRDLLKAVAVVDPLSYDDFLELLSKVRFVISDSGGIQEECAAFQKKVLVCREKTERPEGVDAGLARTVGDDIGNNFKWANDYPEWTGENPYGDGKAAERIVNHIKDYLDQK